MNEGQIVGLGAVLVIVGLTCICAAIALLWSPILALAVAGVALVLAGMVVSGTGMSK